MIKTISGYEYAEILRFFYCVGFAVKSECLVRTKQSVQGIFYAQNK